MRSYYVRAIDYNELKRLKASAKFFERYKHRALVVTNAEVPSNMIVKSFDGDISENRRDWYPWVRSSIVEELNHEFVSRAPISTTEWARAVKRWERARLNIERAEKSLRKARDAEKEAMADIVRVNGMAPLVVNKRVYDVFSYVSKDGKETVGYRERRSKNKLDTV